MPENDWLLCFVLSMNVLFVSIEIESIYCSVLVALSDRELLRVFGKCLNKVIPVLKMVGIWMIGVESGEIWQFATPVQVPLVHCFLFRSAYIIA